MVRSKLAPVFAITLLLSCSDRADRASPPDAGVKSGSAAPAASNDAASSARRARMVELREAQAGAGSEYEFHAVASKRLAATNAARGLEVTVEPTGTLVRDSDTPATNAGLDLEAWGCPGASVALHADGVTFDRRRALVRHRAERGPEVDEWIENGPLGVEQGFDLAAAPPCSDASHVELAVRVTGGLHPVAAKDGESVTLADEHGTPRLRYGELFVRDASERMLPARFETDGDRIVIAFDATGAAYPIEVDPLVVTFRQRLTKGSGSSFGIDVALSGSTLVAGAYNANGTGQAFVYTVAGNTWTEKATLAGTGAVSSAWFGIATAIDGSTVAIGASRDGKDAGSTTTRSGAVYVFTGSGGAWTQQARLVGADAVASDSFGASVSVEGDTLVVGAPGRDDRGSGSGAVYVFTRSGSTWTEATKLYPGATASCCASHEFGQKVVLNGGRIFVGAPGAGRVSVFAGSGSSWTQAQVITTLGTQITSSDFGRELAVSTDTLVVGAPDDTISPSGKAGAYVYRDSGSGFALEAVLEELVVGTAFGSAVAVLGGDAFTGEPYSPAATKVGRVHWYERAGATWSTKTPLDPSVAASSGWFGASLAAANGWLAAGAPGSGGNAVEMFSLRNANGDACASPTECASGFCVDGVCCATACNGACQACSAAAKGSGADGTCGPATSGTDPHSDCATQAATTCGTTGVCNGAGACALYSSGTTCAPASCAGDTSQNEPRTCDGAGTCKSATVTACQAGYRCTGNACLTSCANDGECATGWFCNGGTCTAVKGNGGSCTKASMCQSGFCVDGVCCNSACTASCMACSAAKNGTADGTCANVPNGQDPDDDCTAGGGTCGLTGQCDGAGACAYAPSGKACGTTTCVGNSTTGSICDGKGTCKVDTTGTDCSPYVCSTTTNACTTPCASDAECVAGFFCAQGTCLAKKAPGLACATTHECQSGFCTDGVCCSTACTGLCQACAASLKASGADDGTCGDAAAGTDPRAQCTDDGSTTCQKNGFCDGAGQCALYAQGTQCGAPGCSGDVPTTSECDGAGQCKIQNGASCFPAACNAGTCVGGSCADDTDCAGNAYCAAGACVKKHPNGDACSAPHECATGFCIDGVCCNTVCDGQCEACDLNNAAGTCTGVTGAPHGNRSPCAGPTGSDLCSAKACDPNQSVKTCAGFVTSGDCRAQSCTGGVETFAATCDGSGVCPAPKTKQCTPYVCGGDKCLDACKTNADCGDDTICDAASGKCKPGSSCVDDYTVQEAGKAPVSCLPYRCVAAKCQTECKTVDDCAPGSVCDATFRCVAGAAAGEAPAEDAGGCGCSVPGGGRDVPGLAWLAGAAFALAAARRRRAEPRARSSERV